MFQRVIASLLVLSILSGAVYSPQVAKASPPPTKSELQQLIALLKNAPKDGMGNVWILDRAEKAYARGDNSGGDILLTRYLLQHEEQMKVLAKGDDQLKEPDRLKVIDFLRKYSPDLLIQYAQGVVAGMKAEMKQILEFEKKNRGWVESASWIRNGLLESETERAIDFLNMISIRLNEKGPNQLIRATRFMNELRKFLPIFVKAKEGIIYRYRSIQDRVLLLSTYTYRFYTYSTFTAYSTNDKKEEIRLHQDIGESDAGEDYTRAVFNREHLKEINPVVAVVGAITIEVLTAGTATPFLLALAAGATTAITTASLSPYLMDLADVLKLGGLDNLSAADKIITFGLLAFAVVAASKRVKFPANSRVGKVLAVVKNSKPAQWATKFSAVAKNVGPWMFFAGSFSYGSYLFATAEETARQTGQPVWKVRLDATLLMVCGILGGWKKALNLKTAAQRSAAQEAEAATARQNGTTPAQSTPNFANGPQDFLTRLRTLASDVKACLRSKSPTEMAKILNGNLALKAAISGSGIVYGLGTGKLRMKDLPVELSNFIIRRASGRMTSQMSVDPNTTFFVKYLRVGGVQSGLAGADGIIYVITDKVIKDDNPKADEELFKYVLTRTGYNLSWAAASTAQGIAVDQLLLGLQCMYPLTQATMVPHAVASYAVGTTWSIFYYAGRDKFVGQ